MGLYDRPYMRAPQGDGTFQASHARWWLEHFNYIFIICCAIGWFCTAAATRGVQGAYSDAPWLLYLELSPRTFEQGWVWTGLSYPFIEYNLFALFFGLLLLWYFGDELRSLYGDWNLVWVYFLATVLPAGAYLVTAKLAHEAAWPLYGVGPLVMCVLVIITLWFPRRLIYFMGILPVPLFVLTLFYVIVDLTYFHQGLSDRSRIAASLAGAVLGLAFYFLDLRISRAHALGAWLAPTSRLKTLFDRRKANQPKKRTGSAAKVIDMYDYAARPDSPESVPDGVPSADKARVDALLDKIAKQGKESLTPEELAFLTAASKKYR